VCARSILQFVADNPGVTEEQICEKFSGQGFPREGHLNSIRENADVKYDEIEKSEFIAIISGGISALQEVLLAVASDDPEANNSRILLLILRPDRLRLRL
jgi:hypothetical protein